MAEEEEDDYLSDKFLVESIAESSAPKTYAQRRKEAGKLAALKNEQNRKKSRRQLELEAREEGLSKSLFERAQDEQASGQQNKALSMMMKMGFKPGQSLGRPDENESSVSTPTHIAVEATISEDKGTTTPDTSGSVEKDPQQQRHRADPLPLLEWAGELLYHLVTSKAGLNFNVL